MDDTNEFTPAPGATAADPDAAALAPGDTTVAPIDTDTPPAPTTPEVSAAVIKFRSCRWRAKPEDGEFCTHRDVLPFAGKTAFVADSWCPECAFYKLRRTPKKRDRMDYMY